MEVLINTKGSLPEKYVFLCVISYSTRDQNKWLLSSSNTGLFIFIADQGEFSVSNSSLCENPYTYLLNRSNCLCDSAF
jgi:hypothetical protein